MTKGSRINYCIHKNMKEILQWRGNVGEVGEEHVNLTLIRIESMKEEHTLSIGYRKLHYPHRKVGGEVGGADRKEEKLGVVVVRN